MPARKVSKQSSPQVIGDAAKDLDNKNASKEVKKLAGSVVSDQGKKAATKKKSK